MKPGWIAVIGLAAVGIASVSVYRFSSRPESQTVPTAGTVANEDTAGLPRAPAGQRVRVQVINTTRIPGHARRATRLLRDQGFDVVEMTRNGPMRDSTLVLDRSNHPDWASTIAKLLGPAAKAEPRPDTSRYLDITVLLGAAWRAPAKPFNP